MSTANMYNSIPNPQHITLTAHINLIIVGSILKCSPNPPQTPAIFLSVRDL